jgi:hypothetical protein
VIASRASDQFVGVQNERLEKIRRRAVIFSFFLLSLSITGTRHTGYEQLQRTNEKLAIEGPYDAGARCRVTIIDRHG